MILQNQRNRSDKIAFFATLIGPFRKLPQSKSRKPAVRRRLSSGIIYRQKLNNRNARSLAEISKRLKVAKLTNNRIIFSIKGTKRNRNARQSLLHSPHIIAQNSINGLENIKNFKDLGGGGPLRSQVLRSGGFVVSTGSTTAADTSSGLVRYPLNGGSAPVTPPENPSENPIVPINPIKTPFLSESKWGRKVS